MFDQQKQFLTRMIEENTWPHAVLFVGPDSEAKEEFVWWFVGRVLNVAQPRQSSDVITLGQDAQKTESGRTRMITVERVREVIDRFQLASYGAVKAAIITDAQLLNSAAQNALLKTLEEPLGNALIVLSADDEQAFLPTLLSRVMTVGVYGEGKKVEGEIRKAVEDFLAGGVTERFLFIQKLVKHDEGVAHVEKWLDGLIAFLHEGLPMRWKILDAALIARQKIGEGGNPALLLESVALCEV